MAQLTAAERRHYAEQGYVVPAFTMDSRRITHMVQALDDLLRRNPGVRPEKLVSAHVEGNDQGNGEGVRGSRDFLDLAMDPQIVELVSGAGHDAVPVSEVSPVIMLFVRCFKGISHNPLENVELKDMAAAIKVSDNFIQQLIKEM